ncbi:MAG: indolepyruvate ferredoxin oxidoreductase subunit alpha [Promethearchaeota archaeon]
MTTELENSYEKLRVLLSPSLGVPLPKNELVEKLLTNIFTEEEANLISKGIKKTLRPTTIRRFRKRNKMKKKEAKQILNDMRFKGKIIKVGFLLVMPPYLPGLFEVYFTNNRDNPERMKKAGEAHYELIKSGFHVPHTKRTIPLFRVLPAAEPVEKSIEINKELEVSNKILPYEILEKYLSKFKTFAVQPCSCRTAAAYAGNPCKRTKENFCVSAGLLAKDLIKSGVGRQVDLNELMEIMKRAEREGLVHESTNIQKTSMFVCNCCSCCCGVLKAVKELDNRAGVAVSNFQPKIQIETCKLCKTCINICPMECIYQTEGKIKMDLQKCIGCGVCASNCPHDAILFQKVKDTKPIKGNLKFLRKLKGKS